MGNVYENLQFNVPDFLENPYGIKIYIGKENEDNWCVVIPSKLVNKREIEILESNNHLSKDKSHSWLSFLKQDFTYYGLTENEALEKAEMWTELAKGEK